MPLEDWPREESLGLPLRWVRRMHDVAMHWDGTYRDRFFHTHAFYPPTQKPSTDLKWSAKHRKEN